MVIDACPVAFSCKSLPLRAGAHLQANDVPLFTTIAVVCVSVTSLINPSIFINVASPTAPEPEAPPVLNPKASIVKK